METASEIFSCSVKLEIAGKPPPAVTAVVVAAPMLDSAGGEQVTLFCVNLHEDDKVELEIEGSKGKVELRDRRTEGNLVVLVFATAPNSGSGKKWKLKIHREGVPGTIVAKAEPIGAKDLTGGFVFDFKKKVHLEELYPSFVTEDEVFDDTVVRISGDFADVKKDEDFVLFNKMKIPLKSADETVVSFFLPPKGNFDEVVPVQVVVGHSLSNSVYFKYLPAELTASIVMVSGSSFNRSSNMQVLSPCNYAVAKAVHSRSIINPMYQWTLIEHETDKVVMQTTERKQELFEIPTMLCTPGKLYTVALKLRDVDASLESRTELSLLYSDKVPVIGVSLDVAGVAGGANIPVVVAEVDTSCFGDSEDFVHNWYVDGEPLTGDGGVDSAVQRLGRELHVPLDRLYGKQGLVELEVYIRGQPDNVGFSSVICKDLSAHVEAVIGEGESELFVEPGRDVTLDGHAMLIEWGQETAAEDPRFSWTCSVLASDDTYQDGKSDGVPCNDELVPTRDAASLQVPGAALAKALGEKWAIHVAYSLVVTGEGFTSQPAVLTVNVISHEVSSRVEEGAEPAVVRKPWTERTSVLNVETGARIVLTDMDSTPLYGEIELANGLVIRPKTDDEELRWSFEFLLPTWKCVLCGITSPYSRSSFWVPEKGEFSQSPLVFPPGSLDESTEYEVEVTFKSKSNSEVSQRIKFSSRARPFIQDFNVIQSEESLTVSADCSSDVGCFMYFFAVYPDGKEVCVGSCSGKNVETFDLVQPGDYRIVCRQGDLLGQTVYEEVSYDDALHVPDSGEPVTLDSLSGDLWIAVNAGDDTRALILCYAVVDYLGRQKEQINEPYLNDAIEVASTILRGSNLNHMMTLNYLNLVREMLRLGEPLINHNSQYKILDLVTLVSRQSGTSERYFDSLTESLNLLLVNSTASGHGRTKAVKSVDNPLLDVAVFQRDLLFYESVKRSDCGFRRSTSFNSQFGITTLTSVVLCGAVGFETLRGQHSTYRPCPELFKTDEPKYVFLYETHDYIARSNVQHSNYTSDLLVQIAVMKKNEAGNLYDASMGLVDGCHEVGFRLKQAEAENEFETIEYVNEKVFKVPVEHRGAYDPVPLELEPEMVRSGSDMIYTVHVDNAGLFGLYVKTEEVFDTEASSTLGTSQILIIVFCSLAIVTAFGALIWAFWVFYDRRRKRDELL
mmetsp:Transcript_17585/g.46813  ORF Transcript_17585/g.46813 Transcript_17585/m.46813 type:complete len:1182 (+) Transcript_17585:2385-5930(+)